MHSIRHAGSADFGAYPGNGNNGFDDCGNSCSCCSVAVAHMLLAAPASAASFRAGRIDSHHIIPPKMSPNAPRMPLLGIAEPPKSAHTVANTTPGATIQSDTPDTLAATTPRTLWRMYLKREDKIHTSRPVTLQIEP